MHGRLRPGRYQTVVRNRALVHKAGGACVAARCEVLGGGASVAAPVEQAGLSRFGAA
jgi:hypothetical protein